MMDLKYKAQIKNPILKSFLKEGNHYELFSTYIETQNEEILNIIEEQFKQYYIRILVISYFSKSIHFAAQHFDKKVRQRQVMQPLVLDSTESYNLLDVKEVSNHRRILSDSNILLSSEKLEDYIEQESVYQAIHLLTEKQKTILYLLFIKDINYKEIAQLLNISPQAVYKQKKHALMKIRRYANV